mmetsp:Transcript_352/g.910  ORF Transcript_352/g.910 Transcript_352/m.910 type:complete len:344 (-) Transcript_352:1163-2194(-)
MISSLHTRRYDLRHVHPGCSRSSFVLVIITAIRRGNTGSSSGPVYGPPCGLRCTILESSSKTLSTIVHTYFSGPCSTLRISGALASAVIMMHWGMRAAVSTVSTASLAIIISPWQRPSASSTCSSTRGMCGTASALSMRMIWCSASSVMSAESSVAFARSFAMLCMSMPTWGRKKLAPSTDSPASPLTDSDAMARAAVIRTGRGESSNKDEAAALKHCTATSTEIHCAKLATQCSALPRSTGGVPTVISCRTTSRMKSSGRKRPFVLARSASAHMTATENMQASLRSHHLSCPAARACPAASSWPMTAESTACHPSASNDSQISDTTSAAEMRTLLSKLPASS